MSKNSGQSHRWRWLPDLLVAGLMVCAIIGQMVIAPTESTMGTSQRILYVHVSVAWLGLIGMVVVAATGCLYLIRRDLGWDRWSQAATELGWICCSLTLVTGSLWARSAWGTWWVWEPRLSSAFILWSMYCGCLVLRGNIEDPRRRASVAAVVAIFALLDVPMVLMATRWFRGMHPVSPEMDPMMSATLLLSVFSHSAFFLLLLLRRRAQLKLEAVLAELRQQQRCRLAAFRTSAVSPPRMSAPTWDGGRTLPAGVRQ